MRTAESRELQVFVAITLLLNIIIVWHKILP